MELTAPKEVPPAMSSQLPAFPGAWNQGLFQEGKHSTNLDVDLNGSLFYHCVSSPHPCNSKKNTFQEEVSQGVMARAAPHATFWDLERQSEEDPLNQEKEARNGAWGKGLQNKD